MSTGEKFIIMAVVVVVIALATVFVTLALGMCS
jgi:hypothetical protein